MFCTLLGWQHRQCAPPPLPRYGHRCLVGLEAKNSRNNWNFHRVTVLTKCLKKLLTNSVVRVAMLEGVRSSWKWISRDMVSSGICFTAYIMAIILQIKKIQDSCFVFDWLLNLRVLRFEWLEWKFQILVQGFSTCVPRRHF